MKTIVLFTLLTLTFALHNKESLEIHVFNVGQADSQLIVFPSGYSILIDCGDKDANAKYTKHVAKRIEEVLGKKSIDVFVLTHYHLDHTGTKGKNGIWYLLEKQNFTIGKFVKRHAGSYNGKKLSECNKKTIEWKHIGQINDSMAKFICYAISSKETTKLSKVAENARRCSTTQINPPDDGAQVTVLLRDALGIKDKDTGKIISGNTLNSKNPTSENDFSICLRIQFGKFVYATCGDLSGYTYKGNNKKYHDVESSVAPMMGEVDLMHVNHHGSKSATNTKWCNTLKPTVSVISCGGRSLPNDRPLKNLKKVKSQIYTTGNNCGSNVKKYKDIIQMNDDVVISVPFNATQFTVANSKGEKAKTYDIKMNKKAPEACKKLEK